MVPKDLVIKLFDILWAWIKIIDLEKYKFLYGSPYKILNFFRSIYFDLPLQDIKDLFKKTLYVKVIGNISLYNNS